MITLLYALFGAICLSGIASEASRREVVGKSLYILLGICLFLFVGLREIGADQDSVGYYNYYNLSNARMSSVTEPTFVLIANLARPLSNPASDPRILFLIYGLLGLTIKLVAIRRLTSLYWLALLTYFSYYFLLHEFTQIRAGVASGLLLLSVDYILRRRLAAFILTIGIASLFHYSALLAFPLYFLSGDALNARSKIAIALAIPAGILVRLAGIQFVYIIPIELVRAKIDIYSGLAERQIVSLNVFNAVYLIKYVMLYVLLLFSDNISKESPYFSILIKMYAISMFSYLALSFNTTFAMRMSELFGIVEIILIPLMCYAIRSRPIAIAFVVALAIGNLALGVYQTELIQMDG